MASNAYKSRNEGVLYMDRKKDTDRKRAYNESNYTRCSLTLRDSEAEILTEYSQNLGLSKNALLQKCLVYCYNEMIDVSGVKLSTPEKSGQKQD